MSKKGEIRYARVKFFLQCELFLREDFLQRTFSEERQLQTDDTVTIMLLVVYYRKRNTQHASASTQSCTTTGTVYRSPPPPICSFNLSRASLSPINIRAIA
uniref:Uncharacterized protein n=1 Tax=Pararge aegeria TaxID=116150 RepID=S4P154_9NEOP